MKIYLLLLLVMVAGQSQAAAYGTQQGLAKYVKGDCKLKVNNDLDIDESLYFYHGDCKDGYAHGQGLYRWLDGSEYHGEFKNGLNHGSGILKMKNGDIYEGEFKKDLKDGRGVYTDKDGNSYDGDFKKDLKDGRGVYTDKDGNSYDGDFKKDLKDGRGVYTDKDGNSYDGDWKYDKIWGFGRIYTKLGGLEKEAFYIDEVEVKDCSKKLCDLSDDIYPNFNPKKIDVMMNKINTAVKEERYKDALPYFSALEKYNINLPEIFYFNQILSFSKFDKLSNATMIKSKEYLKNYDNKGKYHNEVLEIWHSKFVESMQHESK